MAMIGAVFPGDFKIKSPSCVALSLGGMNCSSQELGLGDDQSGIMILPGGRAQFRTSTDYLGMSM